MNIYVSGLGIISGIGLNVTETLRSIQLKKSGLGSITLFESIHQGKLPVVEVKRTNTQLAELLLLPTETRYSRTALLGIAATQQAYNDAQLVNHPEIRIGLISSTSIGGMDLTEQFYVDYKNDPNSGDINDVKSHDCADSTEKMARHLGINDFVSTISTACSSGANAIMLGARLIQSGQLDCAIVGGVDALCKFTLNGFHSLMIVDSAPCRPFDDTRAGLNLGEGAGFIVLQNEKTLQRQPYCRLSGWANVNEAYHQTASSPEGDGAYLSMKKALEKGHIAPTGIDYINVHGTATPTNDLSEGKAMQRVFGNQIPAFSSTKAFTGHTLGAAGGIEAVLSVLSIKESIIYPTLNFTTPIADLGLVPETEVKTGVKIRNVLSNSFGFGGNNSTLIFSEV